MKVPELLRGKVVVVSGVGSGLGRTLAVRCAEAGADVVLAARTAFYLDEVAKAVADAGGRALAVPTDITDQAAAEALVAATLESFGRVDALINNALVEPPHTELADTSLDDIRLGMEVDVYAALRLSRLFTPALRDSRGSIVMVNSSVLRHSKRACGAYKIAKSALLALAQSLATELGPEGIRVNTVAPGPMWTDKVKGFIGELAAARGMSLQEGYDEVAADMDLRRLQSPEETADAVIFLASDMARAVTGHCLDVNCGEYHH
ncbi:MULTISPECIES: SDR family oxidoreductase [unclassified Streptomyces]|uniref:SDR family oxidoreductase n=1 Tax=unclassified Streptomyces TaxID=2593676 RepID=UPI000939D43B|nr:SDR family oxidoreductase [Streptomyces sp. TSRI0107]OKJ81220.1 short-chain dehydrogenase [Streptomyces sp. TSRI0107]